jgi:hypothetical protein
MADIDVVKRGSRAWIWILVAIILAVVLWFMMAGTEPRVGNRLDIGGQPLAAAAASPATP